jgi:hypothetical protein
MKDICANLEREIRNCDQLVIWTDCDREGENIGGEIANVCSNVNRRIVVLRAYFSAIIPRYAASKVNALLISICVCQTKDIACISGMGARLFFVAFGSRPCLFSSCTVTFIVRAKI